MIQKKRNDNKKLARLSRHQPHRLHRGAAEGRTKIVKGFLKQISAAGESKNGMFGGFFPFSIFSLSPIFLPVSHPLTASARRLRLAKAGTPNGTLRWFEARVGSGRVWFGLVGVGVGVGLGLASRLGERSITCEAKGGGGRGKREEGKGKRADTHTHTHTRATDPLRPHVRRRGNQHASNGATDRHRQPIPHRGLFDDV